MAQIVYICPFGKGEISGGIKMAYRHVELLIALGFDAAIYQPDGRPAWFDSPAPRFDKDNKHLGRSADDVLVFSEVLLGETEYLVRSWRPARKVLFCQNHHSIFTPLILDNTLEELSIEHVITCGSTPKQFLERILQVENVRAIPNYVDTELFRPHPKQTKIAYMPRKLPNEAGFVQRVFRLKYPEFAAVPWIEIVDKSEAETAEIFGESAVFLSLCDREACPLTPLEAMAAGAIVVGFHGYGGLEYATDANGVWLRPDFLEETADALAAALIGHEAGDRRYDEMRQAGFATAAKYNKEASRDALLDFYSSLFRA